MFENIDDIKALIYFSLLQSKRIQSQLKELRYGKKDLLFKVSVFLSSSSHLLAQYVSDLTYYLA